MGIPGSASGSADFCRTLFETMEDGCVHCRVIYDGNEPVDWVYLEVNPAFETLTGLKSVAGQRASEVVPGIRESSPEIFEVCGRVAAGGGPEILETFVKPLEAWFSAKMVSPGPGEFIVTFKNFTAQKKDVTEQHRIEAELRESEAAFRTIFEMSPVPLFLQREGRFVYLNPAALRLFGAQDATQLIGQPVSDRTPAGELAELMARIGAALDGVKETRFVETRILTLDGAEVHVEVLDRLVTYRGLPTILVSTHDIRERKQSEKALANALDLLERTGELANVGGARLDIKTMQQHWTSQTFRILGLEPGNTPSLEQGLGYYAPEARSVAAAALKACIETGAPYDLDLPAITAKGRSIWVRTQGFPMIEDGRTVEVLGAFQDITERIEADATLRASERKFSLAFLASRDSTSISRLTDGLILDLKGDFYQSSGYTKEEIIGKSSLPGELGLWVRVEDRQRLQEALLRDGVVQEFEAPFRCKDGSVQEVLISAALIEVDGETCILSIIRDNSERKHAEEALRRHEAFIHSILDNLPVGVAVSSSDPTFPSTYMNDLFPRFYRTTREVIEGVAADPDTFWDQVYEDPTTRASIRAQVLDAVGSGDPSRMHWERVPITRKGEETTYIDARNIPVPGTSTMISTVWDVTEQVHREEETRKMELQLHQVQKMESLGLLAGGIAHDINNVLGAILAVATLHRRKAPEGTPLHQDMETIAQACLRGGSLVKSLLGFARKDLREERLLNLNDLIREVLSLLEHTTLKRFTIRADLSDNLREMKGDPSSLNHAIMNLCVNAFDAMPNGGTLTIRTRNEEPNAILVEVEDNGAGMSLEVLHQAMVPFYTTKQGGTGTGLGLSTVYGTVQSHRGTIDMQSEPGHGTCVRLRFPAPDSVQVEKPEKGESKAAGASVGRTILFVDDDPLILKSFPRMIESLGHTVKCVSSGEQALAMVDQGFKADLVILDVNMPGIGGLETLLQLRRRVSTLPVLLSTGFPSQHVLAVVKQYTGVYLIAKPYDMDDLQRQIKVAAP